MNSQEYIEVSILLQPYTEEAAEIAMAEISELPYESFVCEEPLLKCYIQKDAYRASDLKVVLSGLQGIASWTAHLVQGENWNREWEARFEPIVVDGKVTIKAPFHTSVPKTRFNIWIDPQMAFGTGSHDTTCLMMSEMLQHEAEIKGRTVLDMGCGTAILGILAAKMGAHKVQAIDIDLVAAQSAWGNARWNRVGTRIECCCGDASLLQMGRFDVILANINRNILLQDLPTYARSLRRTRAGSEASPLLLLSGFFETDIPLLSETADALGLRVTEERIRNGWACIALKPKIPFEKSVKK